MNWRPGNWEEKVEKAEEEDPTLFGPCESRKIFEAGADAMHKADVELLRIFYPECYFHLQASLTKEQFEAWAK